MALALLRPASLPQPLPPPVLPDAQAIEDGDLVFRRGRDAVSTLVLAHGGGRFSHVGVALRSTTGVVVIHAIPPEGSHPGGVVEEPLEQFAALALAADIAVFRLPGLGDGERQRLRTYLQQRRGTPFDAGLRMSEDDTLYCTELVLRALHAAGVPVPDDLPGVQAPLLAEPAIPPEALLGLPGLQAVTSPAGPPPPRP
ncbi:MAG: hypothetical protein KatS3mg127_0873 [Silanimonas sp.]|nr:MAG: hypothetical protein KatS3mg127_0873 [Silanimonas sp.]